MNTRKLSPRQFGRAVRLGHGSAPLHVIKYGDAGLEKIILAAMLNSYVYDWQIEGSRFYWLYNLAVVTRRLDFYAQQFLEKVKTHKAMGNDRVQHIQICCQLFDIGFVDAREIAMKMYPALLASNPHQASCGNAFVDMAGEAGLQFAARNISDAAAQIDNWDCSCIYKRAESLLDYPEELEKIDEISRKNPANIKFFDAVKEYKRAWEAPREKSRNRPERPNLAEILEKIAKKEHAPHATRYMSYGRGLSADDGAKIYELLKASKDPWEQLCFLRLFENVKIPGVTPELLALMYSPNEQVKRTASSAFGKVRNPLVRSVALSLLTKGKQREIALSIDLLENNYVEGDAEAIEFAVKKLKNVDRLHSAGMAMREILNRHRDAGLERLAFWFYENNPDSFCRHAFLDKLLEWDICPAQTLYEAQWDCCEELQLEARSRLSKAAMSASGQIGEM